MQKAEETRAMPVSAPEIVQSLRFYNDNVYGGSEKAPIVLESTPQEGRCDSLESVCSSEALSRHQTSQKLLTDSITPVPLNEDTFVASSGDGRASEQGGESLEGGIPCAEEIVAARVAAAKELIQKEVEVAQVLGTFFKN
eukprot:CAMPEP_0185793110 /NCGR_PEP_ID=MMETSP1174-20130828/159292_1 /TAXON_ID=35687 /ORGANISM="Dictyocha speculum, Strain CCMP1381" /LENGTH=139 /DNA_ID=CAMNT_0028488223 /DNA_START=744 /DNA_END=1163 /DNA_ORIENTATION=-